MSDDLVADPGEDLATGWGPGTPDDDTVVRQFLLAMADRLVAEAAAVGTAHRSSDDLLLVDTASPVLFENVAFVLRPPAPAGAADVADLVAQAADHFPAGRPWSLLSPFPLPDLRPLGLQPVGHPPIMVRPAGGTPPPRPPELEIEPAVDAEGVAAIDDVARAGFGFDLDRPALDPAVLETGATRYLGRVDGRPVAVSAAHASRGMVEVTWVATLPDDRGRGYGEALTWAATLEAPTWPAGLLASDDGQPVYRRMGYLPVLRAVMWAGEGRGAATDPTAAGSATP